MHVRDTAALSSEGSPSATTSKGGDTRDSIVLLASRLGMGGAERHTISLANLLSRDFRVVVAYLKPEEDMIGQLHRQSLAELRCLHAQSRFDMRAARELAELAQAHGANMIVCANAFSLMYAQLAKAVSSNSLTVMEIFHTTKLRTLKEHLEMVFYRPFFWAAQHLVFVCNGQRQYWRRRGLWAGQTHMIYNGVDVSHFDPARFEGAIRQTREASGFGVADRVVGICAVLRPEKAHIDLLRAVALRRQAGQHWKVLIIGDGPMRDRIEREAVTLGLQHDIRITGFQSDVRQLLVACDVVALPSTAIETFSIAALEAMAMERPMIMSDIGGAREQVEQGVNGLLFPAGDVEALSECLRECWDGARTRQMGLAARQRVERDFSLQTMIGQYVSLFRGILGGRRGDAAAKSR